MQGVTFPWTSCTTYNSTPGFQRQTKAYIINGSLGYLPYPLCLCKKGAGAVLCLKQLQPASCFHSCCCSGKMKSHDITAKISRCFQEQKEKHSLPHVHADSCASQKCLLLPSQLICLQDDQALLALALVSIVEL